MTAKQEKQKKPRNLGRAYLVGKLRDAGLSRRKSLQFLNCIFEEMGQALRAGKEVDFPLGRLKVVPHQHRRQEGIFLGRKRTIYRQRYTVIHEADQRGDRRLNPRPKPSLSRRSQLPPRPKPMIRSGR